MWCKSKTGAEEIRSFELSRKEIFFNYAKEEKNECQIRLTGIEREYWMGTEIGRLGGYGFRGTVTVGDGSNQKGGKMGAGYVNLQKQRKRQQRKVGRKEEGKLARKMAKMHFCYG